MSRRRTDAESGLEPRSSGHALASTPGLRVPARCPLRKFPSADLRSRPGVCTIWHTVNFPRSSAPASRRRERGVRGEPTLTPVREATWRGRHRTRGTHWPFKGGTGRMRGAGRRPAGWAAGGRVGGEAGGRQLGPGAAGTAAARLCLVAEPRPVHAPRAPRTALRGLAQLALAQAWPLASSSTRRRACPPRPADPASTSSAAAARARGSEPPRSILGPPWPRHRPCCSRSGAATQQPEPAARGLQPGPCAPRGAKPRNPGPRSGTRAPRWLGAAESARRRIPRASACPPALPPPGGPAAASGERGDRAETKPTLCGELAAGVECARRRVPPPRTPPAARLGSRTDRGEEIAPPRPPPLAAPGRGFGGPGSELMRPEVASVPPSPGARAGVSVR